MEPTGSGCWIFEINDLTCDVYIYSYSIHQRHISSLLSSQFDDICLQKRNILPNSTWQCHHDFFTFPFKEGHFASQQVLIIGIWEKKSCFSNWEIPKNHLLFLGSQKKSASKNPARYGQPQKRRAMKRLKFCWMRLGPAMAAMPAPNDSL